MSDFCGIPVIVDSALPPGRILLTDLRDLLWVRKPAGGWLLWVTKPPVVVFQAETAGR